MGDDERRMMGMDPDASEAILKFLDDEVASQKKLDSRMDALAHQGDMIWIRRFIDFIKKPEVSGLGPAAPEVGPKLAEDWKQIEEAMGASKPTAAQWEQQMNQINYLQTQQMGQVSAQTLALSTETTNMVTAIKNATVSALQSITDHLTTLQPTLGVSASNQHITGSGATPQDIHSANTTFNKKIQQSTNMDDEARIAGEAGFFH